MTGPGIAVWGAGDHAKVVIDAVRAAGLGPITAVIGPGHPDDSYLGLPVHGSLEALLDSVAVDRFVVAIGDNHSRRKETGVLKATLPEARLVTVVHPAATVAADVQLGPGSVVLAGAVVNPGVVAGSGTLFNTASSTDHDSAIGDFASVGPGAVLGGRVTVGEGSAVSVGATVLQGRRIGRETVVGAGAVVIRDLPDHVVAYGVPAEVVRERRRGDPYL